MGRLFVPGSPGEETGSTEADVVIVGGGPAGLTAAIYTSRETLGTILLEQKQCGGLPLTTDIVENYPGFPEGISGSDLVARMKDQASRFGTEIIEFGEVERIHREENRIVVSGSGHEYRAGAVVVASGSVPKKLDVPGEEEFAGKGVSYCAVCDGPFYKDRDVAVIGCGNSGLQEGMFLLDYVRSVTFVEFLPEMTGAKILQDRLRERKETTFLLNHALTAIEGEDFVESIAVRDKETGEESKVEVSGVFIYAGFQPNTGFLQGVAELSSEGYVRTDEDMRTSAPGIFAAGDVRVKKIRQITTACSDGTVAALSASEYLRDGRSKG